MAQSNQNDKESKPINIAEWNRKGNFKVVVGIDFGTDGSAVAWALTDDPSDVHIAQEMNDNARFVDLKTKTNILLSDKGERIAFGREATEKYIHQFDDDEYADDKDSISKPCNKKQQWLYFDQFKMALYKKALKKRSFQTKNGADDEQKLNNDEMNAPFKTDIKSKLSAANGTKLPSKVVFVEALKFMKEYAFSQFARNCVQIEDESVIKWVLTVPAIWSDKSKGLMEQWAIEAGLISPQKVLNQLVIAYEPDCASISIQNEIKDYKKLLAKKQQHLEDEKAADTPKKPKATKQYLKRGEKYLLLDLGGGTADIACHEVIDDFSVKEIYQPSGGAWGSSYIDRHFLRLLTDLLQPHWLQSFRDRHPSDYVQLKRNFQRAKERFYQREAAQKANDPSMTGFNKQQTHNITLPLEFIDFLEQRLEEYNASLQARNLEMYKDLEDYVAKQTFLGTPGKWVLNEDKLEVDYSIWTHMFDEVIDQIIDHCKDLLSKAPLKDRQCRYICLVGGFSASKYLQARIMYELGIKSQYSQIVIVPKRPSLAVVDGAVRLGLKPDYITSRVVGKTYGIKVNAPLKRYNVKELPSHLVEKNKYFNKRAKAEYLHGIFHAFVRCGEEVKITDAPKTTKFYASKNNVVGIEVYASDEVKPVFTDGKPITKKDVNLPAKWDIHTTFPISFFFGDTKIRVFADIDGIPDNEKEIKLDYEFNVD